MHEEIAERVWEAVGRWMESRREESVQILATLAETQTPSTMYGVALGIAPVAKATLTKMHGSHGHACFWGIRTADRSRRDRP
ncbi:hypothetical protein [Streptomyces sp. MST-110588]|uniref:hypothetical protein n=1 Tax=Streptomyces sp. MST-110588 TaxID=2833628 RepID=UPI001F5D05BA|nr:hypothetical protein [Streptomyces sp. MST-110588]UNO42184.1 hypothetical protein KGS77_25015 [Streptomyces sp. MST-110588]